MFMNIFWQLRHNRNLRKLGMHEYGSFILSTYRYNSRGVIMCSDDNGL